MVLVAFGTLLIGCTEAIQQNLRPLPIAYGAVNAIVVVADKAVWEGPVGDTLQEYYASTYLVLPQPEPIFDLTYVTPEAYTAEEMRREASHYLILADLSDATSPTTQLVLAAIGEKNARRAKKDPTYNTAIVRDKYAEGQLIIYQFAYTQQALMEGIAKNFPATATAFRETDEKIIEYTIYQDGYNLPVENEVQALLGVQMRIPKDYFLASKKDSLVWLRQETGKLSCNIMLKKLPYLGAAQLTKENIKTIRDSIGRKYVASQLQHTYMRTNEEDLPIFVDSKTINTRNALEARGIWEMENDYMGGAFISYLIHNPQKKELLFVDGFIYAPGERKRNWMQNLEFIIRTIKF